MDGDVERRGAEREGDSSSHTLALGILVDGSIVLVKFFGGFQRYEHP